MNDHAIRFFSNLEFLGIFLISRADSNMRKGKAIMHLRNDIVAGCKCANLINITPNAKHNAPKSNCNSHKKFELDAVKHNFLLGHIW